MNTTSTHPRYLLVVYDKIMESRWSVILMEYWKQLERDGLVRQAFPDGLVATLEQFMDLALSPAILFFLCLDTEKMRPCGVCHLTDFHGYSAMVHFSVLRAYHGKEAKNMVDYALSVISGIKRQDGSPCVSTLIGLTPTTNRPAVRFLKRVGFEPLTVIKNSMFIADHQKWVDAILSKKEL